MFLEEKKEGKKSKTHEFPLMVFGVKYLNFL